MLIGWLCLSRFKRKLVYSEIICIVYKKNFKRIFGNFKRIFGERDIIIAKMTKLEDLEKFYFKPQRNLKDIKICAF